MSDESSSTTQGQIRPGQPLTMNLIGSIQTWELYVSYNPQMIFITLVIYLIWGF